MDEYERDMRRDALLHFAIVTPERIQHPRALQHLKEGFNRRLLMLDHSLRRIREQAAKRGERPVSALIIPDLAIDVNSFWLNVCGAIDNLAWALQYELALLPGTTEETSNRVRIALFGTDFQSALRNAAPDLTARLGHYEEWARDLRELRDPAAHRIPLYPVPGVMTEAEGRQFTELDAKATNHFHAGEHAKGMELLHETGSLGRYEPLLSISHDGRFEFLDMMQTVNRDEGKLVDLSSLVLTFLFAPRSSVAAG